MEYKIVSKVGDVETTTDSSGVMEIAGGRHILVELRSGETSERCAGGFLAHAMQVGKYIPMFKSKHIPF